MTFPSNKKHEDLVLAMIEDIPLDHVEIVHLRLEERGGKPRISPADIASSGIRATKAVIRGAAGIILIFMFGYVLLMLLK